MKITFFIMSFAFVIYCCVATPIKSQAQRDHQNVRSYVHVDSSKVQSQIITETQRNQVINTRTAKPLPHHLVGGWLFIYQGKYSGGTYPAFLKNNANLLYLSFMDPRNLTLPDGFAGALKAYGSNHIMMLSLGGLAYGSNWDFLDSSASAVAAANTLVDVLVKNNFDGLDIDAEEGAEQKDPTIMATFIQTIKSAAPHLYISLCVYGNPEGRNFHNYLINNVMNGPALIDWINIMGYGGYDADLSYIQEYYKAPTRQWDPPINSSVPLSQIVNGMKATGGFSSCEPQDYTEMATYATTNGLLGISIWGYLNDNSTFTLSWYDPTCKQGYIDLCKDMQLTTCG